MRSRKASGSFQEIFTIRPCLSDIVAGLPLVLVFVVVLFTVTGLAPSRAFSASDAEPQRLQTDASAKNQELQRLRREIKRLEKVVQGQMEAEAKLKEALTSRDKELELAVEEIMALTHNLAAKDEPQAAEGKELDAALEEVKKKTGLLQEKEQRLRDLGLRLSQTEKELAKAKDELSGREKSLSDLKTNLETLQNRVATLKEKNAGYMNEAGQLKRLLAESKESETGEKVRTAGLQKEILALQSKLKEILGKQASSDADAEGKLRLSQLEDLLKQKDQEIDNLKKLVGYRGEFLAKLEEMFAGVPNIKVQGDRVIFQSEILFAPGKAEISELGKRELDRFSSAYRDIVPRIPKENDLAILVQGHTDADPVTSAKYKSNWELSADRAMQVVHYLIQKGIPPKKIGATALGEFHPVADGESAEAKKLNRRIEIKITSL